MLAKSMPVPPQNRWSRGEAEKNALPAKKGCRFKTSNPPKDPRRSSGAWVRTRFGGWAHRKRENETNRSYEALNEVAGIRVEIQSRQRKSDEMGGVRLGGHLGQPPWMVVGTLSETQGAGLGQLQGKYQRTKIVAEPVSMMCMVQPKAYRSLALYQSASELRSRVKTLTVLAQPLAETPVTCIWEGVAFGCRI